MPWTNTGKNLSCNWEETHWNIKGTGKAPVRPFPVPLISKILSPVPCTFLQMNCHGLFGLIFQYFSDDSHQSSPYQTLPISWSLFQISSSMRLNFFSVCFPTNFKDSFHNYLLDSYMFFPQIPLIPSNSFYPQFPPRTECYLEQRQTGFYTRLHRSMSHLWITSDESTMGWQNGSQHLVPVSIVHVNIIISSRSLCIFSFPKMSLLFL